MRTIDLFDLSDSVVVEFGHVGYTPANIFNLLPKLKLMHCYTCDKFNEDIIIMYMNVVHQHLVQLFQIKEILAYLIHVGFAGQKLSFSFVVVKKWL